MEVVKDILKDVDWFILIMSVIIGFGIYLIPYVPSETVLRLLSIFVKRRGRK